MRTKHSMRKRLQKSCYPPTYASITPILSLSSPSSPDDEEAVKAHTLIKVLIMIISVIVVYEQGVGLKSSITADTAFRKDLPCRGVPTAHYRRRMLAHLSQLLPITGNHFMI